MKHKHILFVLAFCMLSVATISIAYAWVNPTLNPPGGGGAIRVAPGGNVGIGTTAPGSNLTVRRATAGTAFAVRNTADTANTFTISDAGVAHMTGFQLGTTATAGHVLTASATGVGTWAAVTGLPAGATGQTVRHDGTNWVSNSFLTNTGTRIGIGTASPAARLSVVGEGATSATQALNITNSAGVSSLFVRDDGNVGIGTTAPMFRSEVYGLGQTITNMTDAGARGDILALNSDSATSGSGGGLVFGNIQSRAANSLGWAAIKGSLVDGSGRTTGDLAFSLRGLTADTALTERARITAAGNVGIGTTGPGARLDVAGDIRAQGASLRTTGNTGWVNETHGGGWFMQDATWIRTHNERSVWTGGGLLGSHAGLTVGYGGAGSPAGGAIIAGNVGIGTTAPAGRLDVAGSFVTGVGRIDVRPEDGVSEGGQIGLLGAGTHPQFIIDNHSGRLRFVRTSPGGAEVMTMLQDGNVGIGTAAPGARLHVDGNIIAAVPTHPNHVATRGWVEGQLSRQHIVTTRNHRSNIFGGGCDHWPAWFCPSGWSYVTDWNFEALGDDRRSNCFRQTLCRL